MLDNAITDLSKAGAQVIDLSIQPHHEQIAMEGFSAPVVNVAISVPAGIRLAQLQTAMLRAAYTEIERQGGNLPF